VKSWCRARSRGPKGRCHKETRIQKSRSTCWAYRLLLADFWVKALSRSGGRGFVRERPKKKKNQHTDTSNPKRFEQIELQAKLLNYFLGSNKSNINQSKFGILFLNCLHNSVNRQWLRQDSSNAWANVQKSSKGCQVTILQTSLSLFANWVSFDFNVAYSSCWSYSLMNTLKFKKNWSPCLP